MAKKTKPKVSKQPKTPHVLHEAPPVEVLRPLGDRVIVTRDEAESKIGSIHLPEGAKEAPWRGTVISIGPTVDNVAVGDRVYFSAYAGTDVELNGTKSIVMRLSDILAVEE